MSPVMPKPKFTAPSYPKAQAPEAVTASFPDPNIRAKREVLGLQKKISKMDNHQRQYIMNQGFLCQDHLIGYYWHHEGAETEALSNWEGYCLSNGIKMHSILDKPGKDELFIIKSANQWIDQAKGKPRPVMLFDQFFISGEMCILFSDTNVGKSLLAVQIAHSISSGIAIPGFALRATPQVVLYLDCEMGEKQFENRYSTEYSDHFVFGENFKRAQLNPDADMPEGSEWIELVIKQVEDAISETGAMVVIIDNLTFLSESTENAKDAAPLMKLLKRVKTDMGISMLIVAHTPKRDNSKPLEKNDLAGSRMILNFTDSAFAIGTSRQDADTRYLKQIKQRNGAELYGPDNCCICLIEKVKGFTGLTFLRYEAEYKHLKQITPEGREDLKAKAKELSATGKSQRKIAKELDISASTVNKYLNT